MKIGGFTYREAFVIVVVKSIMIAITTLVFLLLKRKLFDSGDDVFLCFMFAVMFIQIPPTPRDKKKPNA